MAQRADETGTTVLHNWCETAALGSPVRFHEPESESQVQDVLRESGPRVQCIGGRYSWPALIDCDGAVALSSLRMRGVISVEGDRIQVYGGTPLCEVGAALRGVGRRVACSPPVIAAQTAAGAVATGTHGQGLRQSTFGDIVHSMALVDAVGRALELDASDEEFGAFRLHLGSLGFVTRLTLATCPNTVYTCEKTTVRQAEIEECLAHAGRAFEFWKAWWFPWEQCAHVWLVREATAPEEREFERNQCSPVSGARVDVGANTAVHSGVRRIARDTKADDLSRPQFCTLLRFRDAQNVTGYLEDIFCRGIPVPQVNCEIGVPMSNLGAALSRMNDWFAPRPPMLHYPVILRPTGPSGAWLSAAYEREACHIGFVVYRATDGSFSPSALAAIDEMQSILAELGGLPHFGKYFDPRRFRFHEWRRWSDFCRVRERRDPGGRFVTPLLRSLFHPKRAGSARP